MVTGAASSALTGLLFVAVSVNAAQITKRPALRASAAKTLLPFGSSLVVAIVLVIPGQAQWVLDVELIAIGTVTATSMLLVGHGKQVGDDDPTAWLSDVLDRTSPNMVTSVLIVLAGISRLIDFGGGLYWLVPAVVLALVGGVTNTWLFLTRLSG